MPLDTFDMIRVLDALTRGRNLELLVLAVQKEHNAQMATGSCQCSLCQGADQLLPNGQAEYDQLLKKLGMDAVL